MTPIVLEIPMIEPVNAVPFLVMTVFIVLDVVFGLCKAFATHSFDSGVMRQGLWHKCALIGVAIMAYLVEITTQFMDFTAVGLPVDFTLPVVGAVTGYVIIMEIGSILESLVQINPELSNGPIIGQFDKLCRQMHGDDTKEVKGDGR